MSKILEVKKVRKQYNDFLLNNISFELEKGTITGFIGENGAGKTTTLSSIMNLIKIDAGQIVVNGREINKMKDMRGVSYLESNRDLYPDVAMNDYKYFISHAYKDTWNEEKYSQYVNKFHIENSKKIKELSTGMKAKFFLAVELAKQPELLLLDEPTSGLDPLARNELLESIKQLAETEEMTIFFSSHITSDIEHIADKVIFIHNGEILLNMNKKDISLRFKKIEAEAFYNLPEKKKQDIETYGIKNFDYYIVDIQKLKSLDLKNLKDVSLDDVLLFLTGGYKIV